MRRFDLVTRPFDNIFDTFFASTVPAEFHPEHFNNKWAAFTVKEEANGLVLSAELAGVKKEDLKIEIVGDTLKVSGHRGTKEAKDNYCEYSEFTRAFTLGNGLDTEKIEAKFENGYLSLLIPKAETQKARLIDVK